MSNNKPEIGKKVPAFSAAAEGADQDTISPKDYLGSTWVLYFYPRDHTSGCTQESIDFTENHTKFRRAKAYVVGISRDTIGSHQKFIKKLSLPFPLIADTDEKVCNLFNTMVDKNMYGKKVRGIERSTFIIDSKGILRHEWRKVKVDGHVQEVLQAVKALNK